MFGGCGAAAGGTPGPAATSATGMPSSASAPPASASAASGAVDAESGLAWVAESALPVQARHTLALIRAGGPYPYPRNDDQTFGNREGRLPARPTGYYKEYTVVTPGEQDRGPRRIIAGREGERYYTDDHYERFRRVREGA
ncbi:MAG: ribonuclease domain-containing protein [Dermatophilaceae bacterium]